MVSNLLNFLKIEVADRFGRSITSAADCIDLSDSILEKTGFYISPNTLRRFFGIIKNNFNPSASTLRILSIYCGYRDYSEFEKHQKTNQDEKYIDNEHCLLQQFIITIFKTMPQEQITGGTCSQFVKHTIYLLSRYPHINQNFQKEIARTANGRYLFETYIDIDHLNSYYGDGIRYYLLENSDDYGFLFGNYLLCLKYWLSNDTNQLASTFNSMTERYKKASGLNTTLYLIAQQLYHDQLNIDTTLHHLNDLQKNIHNVTSAKKILFLNDHLLLILVLTRKYETAIAFMDRVPNHPGDTPDLTAFIENTRLLKAISLFNLGECDVAIELFPAINPDNFHFLSRKLYLILYLGLKAQITGKQSPGNEMDNLIEQTKFHKLKAATLFSNVINTSTI